MAERKLKIEIDPRVLEVLDARLALRNKLAEGTSLPTQGIDFDTRQRYLKIISEADDCVKAEVDKLYEAKVTNRLW